jgi:hypothetical protein
MTRAVSCLVMALACTRLEFPRDQEPVAVTFLKRWLGSWGGIGRVAVAMARHGYDLQLTRYAKEGWRATFYASGREATEVNRQLVDGQRVRLELDAQVRDQYGRLLAYVWVGNVMVNAELVRRGYAQVMTIPPNVKHAELFVRLQREAREAGRGLWAPR